MVPITMDKPIKEEMGKSVGENSRKSLFESSPLAIKAETSSKSLDNKLKIKGLKKSPRVGSVGAGAGISQETPIVKKADISQATPKVKSAGISQARRRIDPGTSSSSGNVVAQIVKNKKNVFDFDGSSTSPHKAFKLEKDVFYCEVDSVRRTEKMLKLIKESE